MSDDAEITYNGRRFPRHQFRGVTLPFEATFRAEDIQSYIPIPRPNFWWSGLFVITAVTVDVHTAPEVLASGAAIAWLARSHLCLQGPLQGTQPSHPQLRLSHRRLVFATPPVVSGSDMNALCMAIETPLSSVIHALQIALVFAGCDVAIVGEIETLRRDSEW